MNEFIGNSFGSKIFGFIQSNTGGGGGQPSTTIPDGYTILGDGSSLLPLRSSSAQFVYENQATLINGKGIYYFTDTNSSFTFNNNSGNILDGQRVTLLNFIYNSSSLFEFVTLIGSGVSVIDQNGFQVDKLSSGSVFEFMYISANNSWILLPYNRYAKIGYNLNPDGAIITNSSVIIEVGFDPESPAGDLYFPDPALHLGESIYIYNSSNAQAPIYNGNANITPILPNGTPVNSLAPNDIDANCYIFTSQNIESPKWVLTGGIIS